MQHDLSMYVKGLNYEQTLERKDTDIQRNVVKHIIMGHPEGVTDLEICIITGFSRTSVTARRNEIPFVHPVGIAKIHDEVGDRLNTLWGIDDG